LRPRESGVSPAAERQAATHTECQVDEGKRGSRGECLLGLISPKTAAEREQKGKTTVPELKESFKGKKTRSDRVEREAKRKRGDLFGKGRLEG